MQKPGQNSIYETGKQDIFHYRDGIFTDILAFGKTASFHIGNKNSAYTDNGFAVAIIRSRYEFARHAAQWDKALADYELASVHISAEYIDAIWAALGDTVDASIIMITKAGRPVALAPLQKSIYPYRGLKLAMAAPFDHAQYGRSDIAILQYPVAVVPVLERAVRKMGVDLWHLDRFPADSPISRYMHVARPAHEIEHYAGYDVALIDSAGSWNGFLAAKSKNFRRSYKRMQLATDGLRKILVTDGADNIERFLDDARTVSAYSWKSEAGSDFAQDETRFRFLGTLARTAAADGRFVGAMLYDGDRPVAFTFGVIDRDTLYALETAYVPEYGERSAGIMSYAMLMQHAFDCDTVTCCDMDLIKDRGAYKRRWATHYAQRTGAFVLLGGFGSFAIRAGRAAAKIKARLARG